MSQVNPCCIFKQTNSSDKGKNIICDKNCGAFVNQKSKCLLQLFNWFNADKKEAIGDYLKEKLICKPTPGFHRTLYYQNKWMIASN